MDILQTISIIVAIWVAIYGMDSWRREHKGKRQVELAEDTLALFYEAKDAMAFIRNPMSYGSETDEVKKGKKETEEQYDARKRASIIFVRYDKKSELFNKIYAKRYKFMALVGKQQSKPFEDLKKIENDIFFSASSLARLWSRNHFRSDEQWDQHFKKTKVHEDVIWGFSGKDDVIGKRIDVVIQDIEEICGSIITGKKSLHGFLTKSRKI